MCTEHTKQVVNGTPGLGIMYRGIPRAERQQTDQGKNDEKKTKYADDFFAHKLVSGYSLLVTGFWLLVASHWLLVVF
jgi:hypothetical protein